MAESLVFGGSVRWIGEHWVARLREPGGIQDRALVSIYATHYSPAGAGHVAAVQIAGEVGLMALYADDARVAEYVVEMWIGNRPPFRDVKPPPVTVATFRQSGDLRSAPVWSIETDSTVVKTIWSEIEPGVTAVRPDPKIHRQRAVANVLFFARQCEVVVNEARIDAAPYEHDLWVTNLGGGDRSSCVFALAETFITPRA